jgi:hypothetical protein
VKQCGIQPEGVPPPTAGEFYVALDEGNVSGTDSRNYYLGEFFDLDIYCLRRVGRFPKDYKGQMLQRDDTYLASIETLEKIERKIVVALHQSFTCMNFINSHFALPDQVKGDKFILPLVYAGRSGSTEKTVPELEGVVFYGRALRFRGLRRNQRKELGSIG